MCISWQECFVEKLYEFGWKTIFKGNHQRKVIRKEEIKVKKKLKDEHDNGLKGVICA